LVKIDSVIDAELHTLISKHRLLQFIAGAGAQRYTPVPVQHSMPWQLLGVRVSVQHPNNLASRARIPGQYGNLTVCGNFSLGNLLYQVYDTLVKFGQHNTAIRIS
jgi:hypothetical protein